MIVIEKVEFGCLRFAFNHLSISLSCTLQICSLILLNESKVCPLIGKWCEMKKNLAPAFSNIISNAELITNIVDFFMSDTFYKIDLSYGEKKYFISL